jgi:hypothetical protein
LSLALLPLCSAREQTAAVGARRWLEGHDGEPARRQEIEGRGSQGHVNGGGEPGWRRRGGRTRKASTRWPGQRRLDVLARSYCVEGVAAPAPGAAREPTLRLGAPRPPAPGDRPTATRRAARAPVSAGLFSLSLFAPSSYCTHTVRCMAR